MLADPTNIADPSNPGNPANPLNPGNPASPLNPVNPDSPLNPANQANPNNPANIAKAAALIASDKPLTSNDLKDFSATDLTTGVHGTLYVDSDGKLRVHSSSRNAGPGHNVVDVNGLHRIDSTDAIGHVVHNGNLVDGNEAVLSDDVNSINSNLGLHGHRIVDAAGRLIVLDAAGRPVVLNSAGHPAVGGTVLSDTANGVVANNGVEETVLSDGSKILTKAHGHRIAGVTGGTVLGDAVSGSLEETVLSDGSKVLTKPGHHIVHDANKVTAGQ